MSQGKWKIGSKYQNKEYIKAKSARHRASDAFKRNYLLKKYGITLEHYDYMVHAQDDKCAICSKKMSSKMERCVDHNHITGQVRALLCRRCNLVLGYINEEARILRYAINYLAKWNS